MTSHASSSELFLPAAIRIDMIPLFTVHELLALEHVDALWRHTLRAAGVWSRFTLHHGNDEQANGALLRRFASAHSRDVTRLELINCALSDTLLLAIGARFTNLRVLVVSGCKALTDDAFAALVGASKQSLVEVRAVKCPLLTDSALACVGTFQSQTLTRVDFSHCRLLTSDGIVAFAQRCTKLQSVGLKGCPKANTAAVVALATSCGAHLRELLVGGSGDVSDTALLALARHCPHLEALDIARSNPFGTSRGGVSDDALLQFVAQCRQLERLVLRGQGQLSLAVLASISAHCVKLQRLDIGGCRQIIQDPVALCVALKRMALLEQLNVSFARGLSDSHISSIATQCPQLKRFEVDGAQVAVVCAT